MSIGLYFRCRQLLAVCLMSTIHSSSIILTTGKFQVSSRYTIICKRHVVSSEKKCLHFLLFRNTWISLKLRRSNSRFITSTKSKQKEIQ